jgi:hypothetical protein
MLPTAAWKEAPTCQRYPARLGVFDILDHAPMQRLLVLERLPYIPQGPARQTSQTLRS